MQADEEFISLAVYCASKVKACACPQVNHSPGIKIGAPEASSSGASLVSALQPSTRLQRQMYPENRLPIWHERSPRPAALFREQSSGPAQGRSERWSAPGPAQLSLLHFPPLPPSTQQASGLGIETSCLCLLPERFESASAPTPFGCR